MSRIQSEWNMYPTCPHCGYVDQAPDLTSANLHHGHKVTECGDCKMPYVIHWKTETEYCGVAHVEKVKP